MQYGDLAARGMDRIVQGFLRVRLGPPLVLLVVLQIILAVYDPLPWRLWTLRILTALSAAVFLTTLIQYRGRRVSEPTLPLNIAFMACLGLTVIHCTGGSDTPANVAVVAVKGIAVMALPFRFGVLIAAG